MNSAIPNLSVDGWVSNRDHIMVKLYELFQSSEEAQSSIYSNVQSLKYIISNGNRPEEISEAIEDALDILYSSYFDNVEVVVDYKPNEEEGKIDLLINIKATYKDKVYELTRAKELFSNNVDIYDTIEDEMYKATNNKNIYKGV